MRLSSLAAAILFVASASAQPNPFYGPAPWRELREFLQLTESQFGVVLESNRQHNEWTLGKQSRIGVLQREIAEQTVRSPLDPIGLGVRYAEVETICREIATRSNEATAANINLLTEVQRTRLKILEEALKLVPTITQAQSIKLLAGPQVGLAGYQITSLISTTDQFSRTDGTRLGSGFAPIAGCAAPILWIDTSEFRPTASMPIRKTIAGLPSNPPTGRVEHRWFDRAP